jgi:hypothetical protein
MAILTMVDQLLTFEWYQQLVAIVIEVEMLQFQSSDNATEQDVTFLVLDGVSFLLINESFPNQLVDIPMTIYIDN